MRLLIPFIAFLPLLACSQPKPITTMSENKTGLETATFANGCFWCTEAIFQQVKGVEKVVSGYIGGTVKNPTYREICTGLTGHAEAIQIEFDPKQVSFSDLLEIFWQTLALWFG